MLRRLLRIIEDWYRGPFVPGVENEYVVIMGAHEPHWTARLARAIITFVASHWQFLIMFGLGLASLWLAA